MPIQISAWERRDSADRNALGGKALELCRIAKACKGMRSARFYWYLADTIVFLWEGEAKALNNPEAAAPVDYYRAAFEFGDMARSIQNWRLSEPRVGEEQYRAAGRSK